MIVKKPELFIAMTPVCLSWCQRWWPGTVSISSPTEGRLDFPFRIDSADPEVFQVTTTSVEGVESDCFCTWRLSVHWTSGTAEGEEIVDMDGQPVAVVNAKPYELYWLENGVWRTY